MQLHIWYGFCQLAKWTEGDLQPSRKQNGETEVTALVGGVLFNQEPGSNHGGDYLADRERARDDQPGHPDENSAPRSQVVDSTPFYERKTKG
jgi:hypothetical protein